MAAAAAERAGIGSSVNRSLNNGESTYTTSLRNSTKRQSNLSSDGENLTDIKTELRGTDEESEGPQQKSQIKQVKQQKKTALNNVTPHLPIIPLSQTMLDFKLEDTSSPFINNGSAVNGYVNHHFPVTPTTVSMMAAAVGCGSHENVYAQAGRSLVAAAAEAACLNSAAAAAVSASHTGWLFNYNFYYFLTN